MTHIHTHTKTRTVSFWPTALSVCLSVQIASSTAGTDDKFPLLAHNVKHYTYTEKKEPWLKLKCRHTPFMFFNSQNPQIPLAILGSNHSAHIHLISYFTFSSGIHFLIDKQFSNSVKSIWPPQVSCAGREWGRESRGGKDCRQEVWCREKGSYNSAHPFQSCQCWCTAGSRHRRNCTRSVFIIQ